MRMTAQRNTTYFPELEGEERAAADEWLFGYLKLVMRIWRDHRNARAESYPQAGVDESSGTGRVRTADRPRLLSQ
jgi:hypothetical protein